MPNSTCIGTLRTALNLGFLHKEPARGGTAHYLYVINTERATGVRGDGLSHKQKELLTALYQNFKTGEFSVYDGAKVVPYKEGTLASHIHNFTQCGILTVRKCPGQADLFTFAVTPERNPDCFLSQPTQARLQGVSSSMPAVIPLAAASA